MELKSQLVGSERRSKGDSPRGTLARGRIAAVVSKRVTFRLKCSVCPAMVTASPSGLRASPGETASLLRSFWEEMLQKP